MISINSAIQIIQAYHYLKAINYSDSESPIKD